VAGFFDPLTTVQAKRLSRLVERERKLAAIVLNGNGTLLTSDARAVLVAALRDVNLVAIADGDEWQDRIAGLEAVRVLQDSAGEAARTAEFVQFVLNRQRNV